METIAVDFDGTLCSYPCADGKQWPFPGEPKLIHRVVLWWIKRRQARGDRIVIWTCRTGDGRDTAEAWLWERGFIPDFWNAEPEEALRGYPKTRKLMFDRVIDDKQVGLIGWMLRKAAYRGCQGFIG